MKHKIYALGFSATLFGVILYANAAFSLLSGIEKELFPSQKRTLSTDAIERSAQDWTSIFLTKEYNPPTNASYVFMPRVGKYDRFNNSYDGSGSQCDKLRIRYKVGDKVITITQTICIFAVQVDLLCDKEVSEISLDQFQEIARSLFVGGNGLELIVNKQSSEIFQGTIKKTAQENTPWLNNVAWWHDSTSIGFYFVKLDGHLSGMMKGVDLFFNANWFSSKPRNKEGKLKGQIRQIKRDGKLKGTAN